MNQTSLMAGFARAMASMGDPGKSLEMVCRSMAESIDGILQVTAYTRCHGSEPKVVARYPVFEHVEGSVTAHLVGHAFESEEMVWRRTPAASYFALQVDGLGIAQCVIAVEASDPNTASDIGWALSVAAELLATASRSFRALNDDIQERAYRRLINARSEMIASLSHEMRTPLASIKGYVTSLLRQDVRWDDTTSRDFLTVIDEETDRLEELITSILDMTAMESGNMPLERTPVLLQALIPSLVKRMSVRITKHVLVFDIEPHLPVVDADPRRIEQVLYNLIDNAVKYSPKGGEIKVRAYNGQGYVTVSVSDQGRGIPERLLPRLFDKFFRVDNTGVRGVGLGLPISKIIVDRHGGKIWAESEVGKGTTVSFTIPVEEPGADQQ